jgi:hypothetical protein
MALANRHCLAGYVVWEVWRYVGAVRWDEK